MKDTEGLGEIGKKDKMYFFLSWKLVEKKDKTEVDILKDTSLAKVTLDCLFTRFDHFV